MISILWVLIPGVILSCSFVSKKRIEFDKEFPKRDRMLRTFLTMSWHVEYLELLLKNRNKNYMAFRKVFSLLCFSFHFLLFSGQSFAQSKRKGVIEETTGTNVKGKKYAFVVGINSYDDPNIGDLDKAENDAAGVAKVLLKYGKFQQIQTFLGKSKNQSQNSEGTSKYLIESEFDKLLSVMSPDDSLVFYFSGHGMTDYDEKNYLLTSDTDLKSLIGTSISVDDMLARTRSKGLKKVIFILDACRNPDKTTQIIGPKYLVNVSFSDVEQYAILYSTKLGYYSYEDDKSAYGVFTKYLIYGMEGRADTNFNAEVTFTELADYVTNSLKDWSAENKKNQKPYVKYYGEKSDDVTFTFVNNPDFSIAELKVYDPYNSRYLFRSLLFPGWGQYARGETTKGKYMMWGSGFLYGMMAFSYYQLRETKETYLSTPGLPPNSQLVETYLINESLISQPRREYQNSIEQMEMFGNLFLLYQIYNIVDFYFFKSNANDQNLSNQIPNRAFQVSYFKERVNGSSSLVEDKTYVFFQTQF